MNQPTSPTLAYATPDLNVGRGSGHDRVINFLTGMQLIVAGIGLTLFVLGWAQTRFAFPPLAVWPLILQWPGYAAASGCAFCGSRLHFVISRPRLYGIYCWAFPALVMIAELGALSRWNLDRESCVAFLIGYPIVALVGNPALIVMGWRRHTWR